jgi:hypothetical protein
VAVESVALCADESLALYVVEDPSPPRPGERRHLVQAGLEAARRAADAADAATAARAGPAAPVDAPTAFRPTVYQIVRLVLARPHDACVAFDGWRSSSGDEVATSAGRLRLGPPAEPFATHLRNIPGRLTLHGSVLPVAVVLELIAWGRWRSAVSLRPERRLPGAMAHHRERRYLAAGHAVMDVITDAVRGAAEGTA